MIDTMDFWDRKAQRYATSPIADMRAYKYTLERTQSHLRADDRVLELGCGTGMTAAHLAPGVGEYVATDMSGEMAKIAQARADEAGLTNMTVRTGGVQDIVFDGGRYDAVLAFNLLHLLDDLPGALAGISRLLRPGGLFISKTICLPDRGFPLKLTLMRAILPLMQLAGQAPHVRITKIRELEREIFHAGFEIIETGNHPANPPSRFIVARRA
ncbi:class I SAM-dependent methyltransferase [Aestuariibius sp. 2305UL40-4]|uniref:class I SAM-dependent methyltransferase n=1 Tax=Aestuariibius violaceus TaxID=3234132 RepID=UPI00345ECCF0